ncbi:hypothetical protein N7526_007258 [Penicillium atrosanguineum]|nr:hypothetical protein N7526_007258 [Penicillium atrosanguineum]
MSLFDMVLLGNYILMHEMAVHVDGRIEFVPTDPQVRATRTHTPMHDLILTLEDLSPDNLSADVLEASEDLWCSEDMPILPEARKRATRSPQATLSKGATVAGTVSMVILPESIPDGGQKWNRNAMNISMTSR